MVDQQTTLYGHHMNDGAMFEPIDASMDQKVFDTFKKVYYITPEMTYVLKPMFTHAGAGRLSGRPPYQFR